MSGAVGPDEMRGWSGPLHDLPGWPWPRSVPALENLQRELGRLRAAAVKLDAGEIRSLGAAAVFVTYPSGVGGPGEAGDAAWAAAALVRDGNLVGAAVERAFTGGPYLAGLLALRCGPLLEHVVRALPEKPDVLMVDATGRDHPRGAGLALHLGAVLELPSIGVTNRALLAQADPPEDEVGATSPLLLGGDLVGFAVRTRRGVNPVLAHAAWCTTPQTARDCVLALRGSARTPQPLRLARTLARVERARDEGRLPG